VLVGRVSERITIDNYLVAIKTRIARSWALKSGTSEAGPGTTR
jgi:hypothetical protein